MSHSQVRSSQVLLQLIRGGALLALALGMCSKPQMSDLTVWRKTRSPLFAASWPPTAETVWVRYTFAYGSNPAELVDGNFVTKPLAKTECKRSLVRTTALSNEMTSAAIQGMVPLDKPTSLILQNEEPYKGDCVKMTALPDPNLPETKEMLAYYRTWFKYNGAFLNLIRKNHGDFIKWIEQTNH